MLGAVTQVRGRGLTWREGRLVAVLGPRPVGAVSSGKLSPPCSPSPASALLPRRAHMSSPLRKGEWGEQDAGALRRGVLVRSCEGHPGSLDRLTLRTARSVLPKSGLRAPRRPRGGGGGATAPKMAPAPPRRRPAAGGRGGRRAAEPRRRLLLASPSSLALTDGRGAPWGGLPARWGRGRRLAHAGATWGRGAARCARSPHPDAGRVCRGRSLGPVHARCAREAGKRAAG